MAEILTSVDDGVLTITMNRPERLNAWTPQMGGEIMTAIDAANDDSDIEGMILTGAGRGFCAGADIEAVFKAQADGQGDAANPDMDDWVSLIRGSKPIVAAINGAAIGVGLSQVLPMDLLIATHEAKLSMRFIKMGLVPELASSHFLTLRCGWGETSQLMLTGKTISGDEAKAVRLVDHVTTPDDLLPVAHAHVRAMGENPQMALRTAKQLLTQNATETDLDEVIKREGRALRACYASAEHKEAIAAFMDKREPDFKAARGAQ